MMVHCTDHQKEERSGNKLYTIKGKKAKQKRKIMVLLPCILQQTDSRRDRNGREKSLQINVQVGGEMSPNPPLALAAVSHVTVKLQLVEDSVLLCQNI